MRRNLVIVRVFSLTPVVVAEQIVVPAPVDDIVGYSRT